jgi:two-component system sensor histidine kinase/response regulator
MIMSDTPSARILIVDDEAAQMTALCDTLKDHGYETVGFTAGQTALEALRESQFDLLLADLMMPEMDGLALLHAALQEDDNLAGIIMTGEGTIATAVEAMKAGALDYILKPFKLSVILPVLSRALAIRRLRMENAALEQRVRERTAELVAANNDLEAFSFSVSHDLRAPLRAINGFSQILKDDYSAQMPADAQHLLAMVTENARRMDKLIDDLLRFSRLGRQPLSKQPVNISALVHEVLDELHKEQTDRQVEVRVVDLPDAIGDPALLKQVFVNLLSNAFKFTLKEEQPVVEVGCRRQEKEQVYFVKDNGAGFNPQDAERLFGVFQRLHSDREFEGTGVGLSLAQRIIRRHGGSIWAESEVDKGATFYFTLPS